MIPGCIVPGFEAFPFDVAPAAEEEARIRLQAGERAGEPALAPKFFVHPSFATEKANPPPEKAMRVCDPASENHRNCENALLFGVSD